MDHVSGKKGACLVFEIFFFILRTNWKLSRKGCLQGRLNMVTRVVSSLRSCMPVTELMFRMHMHLQSIVQIWVSIHQRVKS